MDLFTDRQTAESYLNYRQFFLGMCISHLFSVETFRPYPKIWKPPR